MNVKQQIQIRFPSLSLPHPFPSLRPTDIARLIPAPRQMLKRPSRARTAQARLGRAWEEPFLLYQPQQHWLHWQLACRGQCPGSARAFLLESTIPAPITSSSPAPARHTAVPAAPPAPAPHRPQATLAFPSRAGAAASCSAALSAVTLLPHRESLPFPRTLLLTPCSHHCSLPLPNLLSVHFHSVRSR